MAESEGIRADRSRLFELLSLMLVRQPALDKQVNLRQRSLAWGTDRQLWSRQLVAPIRSGPRSAVNQNVQA